MEDDKKPEKLLEKPGGILGVGCLIIVTMVSIGAIVLGWLGHEMLASNNDPTKRREIASQFLGATELPPDLHPVVAMAMRGTMELVILSDDPLKPDEDTPHFNLEGIYFMRVHGASMGAMPGEFEKQFLKPQNTAESNDLLVPSMRDGRIYESGNFQQSGAQGKFASIRGTLDVFGWHGPGLQNRFSIRCSEIATPTLGIWFMKDLLGDADYDSSPLHIDALRKRLASFNLCPKPETDAQENPPPTKP